MKSIMMCLVLCACSGAPGVEEAPLQEHTIHLPKDNGRIENPTNNASGGCTQGHVIKVEGQLVEVPAACNESPNVDRGDPLLDRGDPEKKLFFKSQSK